MKFKLAHLTLTSVFVLTGCDSPRMSNDTMVALCPPMRLVEAGWKASWSPDGTRLVHGQPRRDGIQILDLRTLKSGSIPGLAKDPDWSPDGRHIAFVREPTHDAYKEEEIWICTPENPQPRRVMTGGFPSWSADGKKLYIHDRRENRILALSVDNPDGQPAVFFERTRSWYPAVAPDEKQIAFGANEQLEIVDRASGQTLLTWPTPGNRGLLAAWSPDGKLVAFGGFEGSTLGVWVLDVAAKRAAPIIEGHYTMPAWSKDGSRLAFDHRFMHRREVWVTGRLWIEARLRDSARTLTQSSKAAQ